MYTFVTGGTGFLGRHLIGKLAERHENIRVLTRHYDPSLDLFGVEQVIGSILDKDVITRALKDVNRIYHLAGRVERDPKNASSMYEIHVDGTVALLDAVRKVNEDAGGKQVEKIVVASTSGTVAVSDSPDVIADNDAPYADEIVSRWPYYLSKIYEERVVDRYIKHFQLPIVTMRPTLLLGPGDVRRSSTEDVASFLNGDVRAVPKGGISFVDVRDVADAFIKAMDRAEPGSKYLLGAANMTLHAFFDILASMTDKPAPIEVDERIVKTGARIVRGLRKVLNRKESVAFDPVSIDMAHHYWYLDATQTERELGWRPRNIEVTLRDTIDWLNDNHEDFVPKKHGRRTPPSNFVPKETLEYANRIRKAPATDPHEFDDE